MAAVNPCCINNTSDLRITSGLNFEKVHAAFSYHEIYPLIASNENSSLLCCLPFRNAEDTASPALPGVSKQC